MNNNNIKEIGGPVPEHLLPPPGRRPKLAIFGGSFDPIHLGHLSLAEEIVMNQLADEVLFIPAKVSPHKLEGAAASSQDRYNMVLEAIKEYPRFSASDIELCREDDKPSYSIETLETMSQAFPEHKLLFVIGMDSLLQLHKWYKATEMVNKFSFIIYPRAGYANPGFAQLSSNFGARSAQKLVESIVDLQTYDVSSTEIRLDCQESKNISGRVPEAVKKYIRENKIYQEEKVD